MSIDPVIPNLQSKPVNRNHKSERSNLYCNLVAKNVYSPPIYCTLQTSNRSLHPAMTLLEQTLHQHQIRVTAVRRLILSIFSRAGFALSHADIERQLGHDYDRVTIYRTLRTFLEKGLIHKVTDDAGVARYALCDLQKCNVESHADEHVHFKCVHCGHIFCLNSVDLPPLHLPEGYVWYATTIIVDGLCKTCKEGL